MDNIPNTIADILDSLDGKIELNKQINDNLEANSHTLQNKHSQICEYNKSLLLLHYANRI